MVSLVLNPLSKIIPIQLNKTTVLLLGIGIEVYRCLEILLPNKNLVN